MTVKTPQALEVQNAPSKLDAYIKLLVYGETGSGKTRLVASSESVPQMSPALLIDFDRGTDSVEWPLDKLFVTKFEQINPALKVAQSGKYKTVILDTLTELYRFMLDEAMRLDGLKHPSRQTDIPERQDYLMAHEMMRRLLRRCRDFPMHILCTAQRGQDWDPVTNEVRGLGPMISGRLNREVGAFFNLIGFLEVNRQGTVDFHSEPMYQVATKDRRHLIPGILETPTMSELYGYYFGKEDEAEPPKKKKLKGA